MVIYPEPTPSIACRRLSNAFFDTTISTGSNTWYAVNYFRNLDENRTQRNYTCALILLAINSHTKQNKQSVIRDICYMQYALRCTVTRVWYIVVCFDSSWPCRTNGCWIPMIFPNAQDIGIGIPVWEWFIFKLQEFDI